MNRFRHRSGLLSLILLAPLTGCAIAVGGTGSGSSSGTGDGNPAVMQGIIPFAALMIAALVIAIVWWGDD